MWIKFCHAFVKVTGWLPQRLVFRTKIYCEDPKIQNRHIRGSAILVSNHTSIYDFAAYLFVFLSRTLRFQMAEVLFEKKIIAAFLRSLGGIYVDRNVHDLSFVTKSEEILRKGGVVGIFPEGRLPRPGETPPLPFTSGATFLALSTGVPVIPVYTTGGYFRKGRARVMIGTPLYARELVDENLSEKENLVRISELIRRRVIELGEKLDERT